MRPCQHARLVGLVDCTLQGVPVVAVLTAAGSGVVWYEVCVCVCVCWWGVCVCGGVVVVVVVAA